MSSSREDWVKKELRLRKITKKIILTVAITVFLIPALVILYFLACKFFPARVIYSDTSYNGHNVKICEDGFNNRLGEATGHWVIVKVDGVTVSRFFILLDYSSFSLRKDNIINDIDSENEYKIRFDPSRNGGSQYITFSSDFKAVTDACVYEYYHINDDINDYNVPHLDSWG